MNLRLFFNPFTEEELERFADKQALFEEIDYHHDSLPNWQEAEIAIFSVDLAIDSESQETNHHAAREELAKLKAFSRYCKIIDLGMLRLGETVLDTQMRVAEVCELLISQNTLPVILSNNHAIEFGQFLAYRDLEKLISIASIDAKIDLLDETHAASEYHLHQIFSHHPNFLFDYAHLGYQRYLNQPTILETLQMLNFEARSVGEMRQNFSDIEPIVRMADMVSFDLSAVKRGDISAQNSASPFGLTGEEACQVCWYAGMNEKLTSFGIYEYAGELDKENQSASVVAIMLWYFIEGFCHRKEEYSFKSNFHIRYLVPLKESETTLVFYKSKTTDKWWLEVGDSKSEQGKFGRKIIVPCSYSDYETANKGEIPERWLKAQDKIG
ncbi:MAG: formiminoglutamase [Flammeovirgaceae bacterium]|jgi:formiminoglutamase